MAPGSSPRSVTAVTAGSGGAVRGYLGGSVPPNPAPAGVAGGASRAVLPRHRILPEGGGLERI